MKKLKKRAPGVKINPRDIDWGIEFEEVVNGNNIVATPKNLSLLVAMLIPPGTLQKADDADKREAILNAAVDCALHVHLYCEKRNHEFAHDIKTSLCESTLGSHLSRETLAWYRERKIIPAFQPLWEKGALRFEPDKRTDDFRKYLKDEHGIEYTKPGYLWAALRQWRESIASFCTSWMKETGATAKEINHTNTRLVLNWCSECDRGGYFLIRLSDAESFASWKKEAPREANRKSQAKSRANRKAKPATVTKKPKAHKVT